MEQDCYEKSGQAPRALFESQGGEGQKKPCCELHKARVVSFSGGQAKVRARGARSQQWYSDARATCLRKHARTQMLWNLLLAGDWHGSLEAGPQLTRPHLMRCMLVSNLAVDQRFANGTLLKQMRSICCYCCPLVLEKRLREGHRAACSLGLLRATRAREGRSPHIAPTWLLALQKRPVLRSLFSIPTSISWRAGSDKTYSLFNSLFL